MLMKMMVCFKYKVQSYHINNISEMAMHFKFRDLYKT
jgi:hypothetical protein